MQNQPEPQREPVQTIPYAIPSRRLFHPLAIVSLICGLLFFLPIVTAVLAIVFGWIARSRIASNPQYRGKGMALAGMILGVMSLVGFALTIPLAIRARQQANQVKCASNLRSMMLATIMYTNDNKGLMPANAAALTPYIRDPRVFICPECGQVTAAGGQIGTSTSYIYLGSQVGANMRRIPRPSQTIIAYEPMSNHGGRGFNAAFLDGHVEWIPKDRAATVMQQIQRSSASATMPSAK